MGGKWQEPGDTQQVTDKILTVCFLPLHACSSSLQSCSLPYCAGLLDGRAQDATKPEKSAKWCGIEIFPLSFQPEHFVFLFWSRDLKNVLSVLSHWVMSGIFGSLRSSRNFNSLSYPKCFASLFEVLTQDCRVLFEVLSFIDHFCHSARLMYWCISFLCLIVYKLCGLVRCVFELRGYLGTVMDEKR